MLRVLTLSTLFPDAARPTLGVFVERQTLGLAAHADVDLRVVSPVGLPPWPLDRHPRYRPLATLPLREDWKGLDVLRPRFRKLPGLSGAAMPGAIVRALRPVLRDLRRDFPFDVIDAEFFFPDGPAAVALGRHFGVPVSIKARGSDIHRWGAWPKTGPLVRDAGCRADGLLAVSAAIKRDMVAMGMPPDRITVHYTGVDLDRFRPADRAAAKAALGIAGPLLLTVGTLNHSKGHHLVIEALADLPSATLIIAGAGPDHALLAALAAQRGLADRVRLIGPQPHHALPALFAAADVMALPSASEGLANVWVEALASGTPIVIADVGGARELVDRPAAGALVARDPKAIAAAIQMLLAFPPDPLAVRATVERFTWAANTAALHAHLSGLVQPRA